MTAKLTFIALAAIASLAAPAAQAQLIRQTVDGVWRHCVYQGRARLGSSNPRQRLGMPSERVARVGRGEPCPAAFSGEQRRRRPPPPVSTWSSEPQ